MLIKAALTTNVLVILAHHCIVCVGMFAWLMVTLGTSAAVCGTINPAEKSAQPEKEDAHTQANTGTHTHTRELHNATGNNNKAVQL